MIKKIFLFLLIIVLGILNMACAIKPNNSIEKKQSLNDFYKVVENVDKTYTLILYDKNKKIMTKEAFIKDHSYIEVLDNSILKIETFTGSPLNYTHFYDTKTGKLSPEYENLKLYEKGKVVYMDKNTLVISDAFDKKLFFKEVKRNFSPTAVPSNVILNAKFIAPNKLLVDYLEGNNYTEKTEVIDLTKS